MSFQESILINCETEGCPNSFRHIPRKKFNSTIWVKPQEFCQCCLNQKAFAKRKKAIVKLQPNPKVNLYGRLHKNFPKTDKNEAQKLNNTFPKNCRVKTKRDRVAWFNKPTNRMIPHVQSFFCNKYIRERDQTNHFNKCISCNNENIEEAGHRYSVGDFPGMRLLISNIHGQGHNCNGHLNGNGLEYDKGLIERHGQKYQQELKNTAHQYQHSHNKLLRHEIIEIGYTYKYLLENKIWIYTPEEFLHYKNIANQ